MVALSFDTSVLETSDADLTPREQKLMKAAHKLLEAFKDERARRIETEFDAGMAIQALLNVQKIVQSKPAKKITKPILEALLQQVMDEIDRALAEPTNETSG